MVFNGVIVVSRQIAQSTSPLKTVGTVLTVDTDKDAFCQGFKITFAGFTGYVAFM